MLNKAQQFGKYGEAVAATYLKAKGYKIIKQNYRTSLGEIDIIAKDKDTIVFIEVKSRKTNYFGNAKQAITPKKQKKISMAALLYLKKEKKSNAKARFDVITIQPGKTDPEIIKNAFELAYS